MENQHAQDVDGRPNADAPNGDCAEHLRRGGHRLTAQQNLRDSHEADANEIEQAEDDTHGPLNSALGMTEEHE